MKELAKAYDPKAVEDRWYSFWEEKGYFHADPDSAKKPYTIVIPPPNITGILHMGHALNNTIQDILIRWKKMQGFEALWMPGTDHAGIATQNVVERRLKQRGLKREDLGREKFLEEVWKWRREYGSTIITQLKKLGCACDWARTRFTMDEGLSTAVQEVFIRLYRKGLIYRGRYIINWCPRCQTALSDEEAHHRDVEGALYYIKYPLKEGGQPEGPAGKRSKSKPANRQTGKPANHVIVATTRPETMLGDVAVAVNPKDKRYAFLKGRTVILPILNRELKVITDPLVDASFGTGALKVTPAHDPVDFRLALKHGLEFLNVMNPDATINEAGGDFRGMDRLEAREAIIDDLKEAGLFVKSEPHRHAVGHCYRCHTMIEPRLSPQWFVSMKPLAKKAAAVVRKREIVFFPARWTKVYLKWMDEIRDWCISRQIWWGHRIPVYYCKRCSVTSNRKPVTREKETNKKKHEAPGVIVAKTRPERCGECGSTDLEQDPDVLDTWFSSWLWPFSTLGWPEKTRELGFFYPTDALVTAQEIIFFWVARMVMAGLEFAGDIPFRQVYIHGTVRDDTGTKMSKSLGNIIDPLAMIDKYGADALRFSIISITAQGQDVFLSETKFERGRNFANKIWNASRFILMNLEPDKVRADLCAVYAAEKLDLADRWILSRLYRTLSAVGKSLEAFRFNDAANALYEFFWHEFCDWYIEIGKPRIGERVTQVILYKVLEKSLRMLHPLMPFLTEEIWQALPHEGDSIMTQPWPHIQKQMISREAETGMAAVIEVVTAVRNMRADWNIPPGSGVTVMLSTPDTKLAELIRANAAYVTGLARAAELTVGQFSKPEGAAVTVLTGCEVYLPLAGLIDPEKERGRIEKQLAALTRERAAASARLENGQFVKKAPPEVVARQRERLAELAAQIARLEENLRDLR